MVLHLKVKKNTLFHAENDIYCIMKQIEVIEVIETSPEVYTELSQTSELELFEKK